LRAQLAAYTKTMEEELRWAGEMQRAILRPTLVRSDGVEFRSSYRPVPGLFCGGDYYDVICLGPDRYLILVGDVAGHGVKAALITSVLKAVIYPEYVRGIVGKRFSPSAFLGWLNDRMSFELRQTSGMLIGFMAGVLDRGAMTFTYANAGQPHPMIISGSSVRELPASGSKIGFALSVMYTENTESLSSGDMIFAYSDGLSTARTGSASAPRMAEILASIPYGPDFHKRTMDEILAASGDREFTDDVTIVTARLA
ncbi:MAG: SpoIIE family protein phosphatase, partial [Spirochaetaceae bacterium]|nr:SpoIIE family protein phosphatase [Spirochaetaceae bacterium]